MQIILPISFSNSLQIEMGELAILAQYTLRLDNRAVNPVMAMPKT